MLSIIIPVYNVENYLPACLDSLTAQSYRDFEAILVDDGSTDSSGRICDEYAAGNAAVTVIHKKNGGLSSARNAGIRAAHGQYLLFIDSDDWIRHDTLLCLMNAAGRYPEAQCITFGYYMDYPQEGYSQTRSYPVPDAECRGVREAILLMESQGMLNLAWNKLYSARILQENGLFFAERMEPGEDILFNCRYFQYVSQCVLIPDMLYHYMNRGGPTLSARFDPRLSEKIPVFIQARETLYSALQMTDDDSMLALDQAYFDYYEVGLYNYYKSADDSTRETRTGLLRHMFSDDRIRRIVNSHDFGSTVYRRIFRMLFRTGNPLAAEQVYRLLFCLRKRCSALYGLVRQRAGNKSGTNSGELKK